MIKLRVFIVDDIPSMRVLVGQFLKKHKDVVIVGEAGGCEEAIQKIRQAGPDVVLTDMSLSDGSGVEVARRVKEMMPETSVYLFSAYEVDEIRELQSLQSPADGFIQKSNMKPELEAMIVKEFTARK